MSFCRCSACWRVRYTGVLRGRPRCPLVFWAGFCAGLRDATAVVDWAGEALRFGLDCTDLLLDWRCAGAALDIWPDLARKGLALLDAKTSTGSDAGEDG